MTTKEPADPARQRGENRPLAGHPPWVPGVRIAVWIALSVAVFAGWRLFWFLTDDAYIAFRYVSNGVAGYGWTWNPPPFRPVEGYTSFLWVFLLDAIWRLTGVQPPEVANWLSLAFGYGTLAVSFGISKRMTLPAAMAPYRFALAATALLGVVTNRTFLAWLSSGLETSMFNFLVVAWIWCVLKPPDGHDARWAAGLSLIATCAALARPDGLLIYGVTLVLLLVRPRRGGVTATRSWTRWASCSPLVGVPAHLLFRRLTYGEWLPNTYHAKHVAAWPESGVRYLLSFVVEYGVWVWLLLLLAWLVLGRRGGRRGPSVSRNALVVGGVLGVHLAYYTVVIGGDHFEYRVYSHLVPLLFLSAAWLAARLSSRAVVVFALLGSLVLASWPIPWVHWRETRGLETRAATYMLVRPIARHFPGWLRPPVEHWDRWQAWLIRHHVGMRHQEHKVFHETQVDEWPDRDQGSGIRWRQRAVLAHVVVGVPGWVLPEVAIIDLRGLNDRVIARTPLKPGQERMMAHDRWPPEGYVRCFRPNARLRERKVVVRPRERPLTDETIVACESRDWLSGDAANAP